MALAVSVDLTWIRSQEEEVLEESEREHDAISMNYWRTAAIAGMLMVLLVNDFSCVFRFCDFFLLVMVALSAMREPERAVDRFLLSEDTSALSLGHKGEDDHIVQKIKYNAQNGDVNAMVLVCFLG